MSLLLLASLLPVALANSTGKTGNTTSGCRDCHGTRGDSTTSVSFSVSSTTVEPGATLPIQLLVGSSSGSRVAGGLDVSASGGALSAGTNTILLGSEITHSAATAFTSGSVAFDFTWTAPSTEGTVTLRAAGNAVNGDGSDRGDGWALATPLVITVDDPCDDYDADGWDTCTGDCDDADPLVHPDATETCDGLDNDCDGEVDGAGAAGASTWYRDNDGDGYGEPSSALESCEAPPGYVALDGDCNDTNTGAHPGATEVCDPYDGDEDCDGLADDADADATGLTTWFLDADGDGFGGATSIASCEAPSGYVLFPGDCDDADPEFRPSAVESCGDPRDLNCDGAVGSVDGDGDGWYACEECDDSASGVYPGATESCNLVDDDCDGAVDDGPPADAPLWYADADGDGHGDPASTIAACQQPEGYLATGDDCDDNAATTFPGAVETWYDGVDGDCDGASDYDADGDGHDADTWAGDDCDDEDPATWPGAPDVPYDGAINDCDASDEFDVDGDGAEVPDDCDDTDAGVFPGAEEQWYDGVDQNCDGNDTDQDLDGTPVDDDCDDTDPSRAIDCDSGETADTANEPDDTGTAKTDDTGAESDGSCGCQIRPGAPVSTAVWVATLGLAFVGRRRRA